MGMNKLAGKIAVVTGAASGIGHGIAGIFTQSLLADMPVADWDRVVNGGDVML